MTKLKELAINEFDNFNSIEMAKICDFIQFIKAHGIVYAAPMKVVPVLFQKIITKTFLREEWKLNPKNKGVWVWQ